MYLVRRIVKVLTIVFTLSVCICGFPSSANALAPLDGSIEGLWAEINNPFPLEPTNALDFVDTLEDGTHISTADFLGYATKWNGNSDTRVKYSAELDGQTVDVLTVTNTAEKPWQAGRWGMTPLFTVKDHKSVADLSSKIRSRARWSVDVKVDLGNKMNSTLTSFISPMGWDTNKNRAVVMETKPFFQFSRDTSENKYKITNGVGEQKSVTLDGGKWYRYQLEFAMDDYIGKPNDNVTATISAAVYGFNEDGTLNTSALEKWDDIPWTSVETDGFETWCQEMYVTVRNTNILSYSVANAYMVRDSWCGEVSVAEAEGKIVASAAVYPQFTAGGSYEAPSDDGTPVLVLAGYDALNTLVTAKADVADFSTPMSCELNVDDKVAKYGAYLWTAPELMRLFASPVLYDIEP